MEINAGLADPKLRARLADFGGTPLPGSPADFGKLADTEKWSVVQGSQVRRFEAGVNSDIPIRESADGHALSMGQRTAPANTTDSS